MSLSALIATLTLQTAALDPCIAEDSRSWPVFVASSGVGSEYRREDFTPSSETGRPDLFSSPQVNVRVGLRISAFNVEPNNRNAVSGSVRADQNMEIPLCALAQRSELLALAETLHGAVGVNQARIEALESQMAGFSGAVAGFPAQLATLNERTRQRVESGTALSAALMAVSPAPGRNYRLGFEVGAAGDQHALAVNFAARRDQMDMSASFAVSDDNAAARLGGGFSW
ncbi:hypothetical protein [Maricaulis sp.]|uniref:hypothetical protein n=1 Tax=Maricaulis sp. TaxID=1486257 RepID=UPI002B277FF5|nr:hypothetical protein [Maricaulis sp.]